LYDFAEVEVALQMVFLLRSLVDSLFVLALAWFAVFLLEALVIIEFGHFVRVFEEVVLQKSQLLLNHSFALVFIYFSHCCCEPFVAAAMAGFWYYVRHYQIYKLRNKSSN
jgi:hypothetical protein